MISDLDDVISGRARWHIAQGDCLEHLKPGCPLEGTVRLAFADPPYNIGVDYGNGPKADRVDRDAYLDWCREWTTAVARQLTNDGAFWVLCPDENAAEFKVMLDGVGLKLRSWVKWHETFGVHCTRRFGRTSRHLLYYVKSAKNFLFNEDAVRVPSARQAIYGDKRADPRGKVMDDVWRIPRLVGNASERLSGFPTQLPLNLLRPVVAACSEPGDLVLDPFAGSGTTGEAALESGRRFAGCELSETYAARAAARLAEVKPLEDE